MTEFSPGDTVHVKVKLLNVEALNLDLGAPVCIKFRREDIVHHEKAPWKPKVGDEVIVNDIAEGRIIAIDGDEAWVKFTNSNVKKTAPFSSLRKL